MLSHSMDTAGGAGHITHPRSPALLPEAHLQMTLPIPWCTQGAWLKCSAHPLKYVVSTKGILVTVAGLRLPRTSTRNSVPAFVYLRGT